MISLFKEHFFNQRGLLRLSPIQEEDFKELRFNRLYLFVPSLTEEEERPSVLTVTFRLLEWLVQNSNMRHVLPFPYIWKIKIK